MQPIPYTVAERQELLEREIAKYNRRGYWVVSQTTTTAELVRLKRFSRRWALIWLLFFGVGIVVYLLYYATRREQQVILEVDYLGVVHRR